MLTRRQASRIIALVPAVGRISAAPPWDESWDRAVLSSALTSADELFDPKESMVTRRLGPDYQYHTNLRNMTAHPTRESLEYALYLLEDGSDERHERAEKVIERVLALQETDPRGTWYGLWGWYLEEPAPKMSPADWNWADFNGSTLLFILGRHGKKLRSDIRHGVQEAVRHAAYSVKRRDVKMGYTNIAVKGTFVTLASSEMLELNDLGAYAKARLNSLAGYIDRTGSFEEYNSPTYTRVTIADLTRIRMLVRGMAVKRLADRIHERAWLHLASHWHPGTWQLAGPMSRCYENDIGTPLWLQKALGGALAFATIGEVRSSGEVALLDYECPEHLRSYFLGGNERRQHRELFYAAKPPEESVQGTTWLDSEFCLGSANKSGFWVQRRPLLAYWGGAERPARYLQLRVMKDDYDFSSALFYSVQENGSVLGLINFRSPGGDRHVSLDPIQDGAFDCTRLRVRADLAGVPETAKLLVDGKAARPSGEKLLPGSRIAIDLGGTHLWIRFPRAVFGDNHPTLSIEREEGLLAISLDLHHSARPQTIRWSEVRTAWVAVNLVMAPAEVSLEEFSLGCAMGALEPRLTKDAVRLIWQSPAGRLWLEGLSRIAPVDEHDAAYRAGIRSGPVPVERLSEKMLVS